MATPLITTWRTVQNFAPIELGRACELVECFDQLFGLIIERFAIGTRVRIIGRLHCEFTQATEQAAHFGKARFRGLNERDTVLNVALRLVERAYLVFMCEVIDKPAASSLRS